MGREEYLYSVKAPASPTLFRLRAGGRWRAHPRRITLA
jgi:hypothetical protein